jgi:hypothetical protein
LSRAKRLFPGEPAEAILTATARSLLNRWFGDLSDDVAELRELGTATFLDRPLGIYKSDRDEDRTILLSYEACSARMIRSRLAELRDAGFLDAARAAELEPAPPAGFAVARLLGHARRGVVSLEDAKKVALDFVFTRTTRSSLGTLAEQYNFSSLNAAAPRPYHLLIRTARSRLTAFDATLRPVFELELPERPRYIECGGVEYVEDLCAIVDGRRIPLPPRLGC